MLPSSPHNFFFKAFIQNEILQTSLIQESLGLGLGSIISQYPFTVLKNLEMNLDLGLGF